MALSDATCVRLRVFAIEASGEMRKMGASTHIAVEGGVRGSGLPMERSADHPQRLDDPNGQISRTRALVTAVAAVLLPMLLLAVAALITGR